MELSVVISTLNDREQLVSCLDAVSNRTPDSTELIVVNGPSSDGTSGVVRQRSDIDVLVEISERNPNVSRNAGLEAATGDIVAFVDGEYAVEPAGLTNSAQARRPVTARILSESGSVTLHSPRYSC